MGCNCGKQRLAPNQEYVVIHNDGSTTTGYTSEAQAKIAAAKLGGVAKVQDKA